LTGVQLPFRELRFTDYLTEPCEIQDKSSWLLVRISPLEGKNVKIFTATVFLCGEECDWTAEISFPAPDGVRAIWGRVYDILSAIIAKVRTLPNPATLELGLYLEVEDITKPDRCRLAFWELMQNCQQPLSVTWIKQDHQKQGA